MSSQPSYRHLLETSQRVNWRLEDLVGDDRHLDFSRPFLPETFARAESLGFLRSAEKLALNQIRARGYLALFELVEALVVPFISRQAEQGEASEPYRAQALENFAAEEQKHRKLFRTVLHDFDAQFAARCGLIGPPDEICRAILGHDPLAVTIAILGLEWMSQGHYVGSIKDDRNLDPQFRSLLKHHWIEEAQHARLDALILQTLCRQRSPRQIANEIEEYFEIGSFLDAGFLQQAELDLESLERVMARHLQLHERREFLDVQHQALRWTFLGSAMSNRNFLAVLAAANEDAGRRVAEAAEAFSARDRSSAAH